MHSESFDVEFSIRSVPSCSIIKGQLQAYSTLTVRESKRSSALSEMDRAELKTAEWDWVSAGERMTARESFRRTGSCSYATGPLRERKQETPWKKQSVEGVGG